MAGVDLLGCDARNLEDTAEFGEREAPFLRSLMSLLFLAVRGFDIRFSIKQRPAIRWGKLLDE
jgi:hypothetical protein